MLPKPSVKFVASGDAPSTEEGIRGIIVNPVYCGVGPYPRVVEDEAYVESCVNLIQQEGAEQFLVNLLYILRETLDSGIDNRAVDEPNPGNGKTSGERGA